MSTPETENDFDFYLRFVKPLVFSLSEPNDRALAAAWVQKLRDEKVGDEQLRTNYLKLLLFVLQRKKLIGVFSVNPNEYDKLEELPEANLHNVARDLLAAEENYRKQQLGPSGDFPPYSTEHSADLLEYSAAQDIPNFGVHAYYAISSEPLPNWERTEKAAFPRGVASATERSITRSEATSRVSTVISEPTLDVQSTPSKDESDRRSRSKSRSRSRSKSKSRKDTSSVSEDDGTEGGDRSKMFTAEPRRVSPKRKSLGDALPSPPLGAEVKEDKIREAPTWGSNLIGVSEPPVREITTESLPDEDQELLQSEADVLAARSISSDSSGYPSLPYKTPSPKKRQPCVPCGSRSPSTPYSPFLPQGEADLFFLGTPPSFLEAASLSDVSSIRVSPEKAAVLQVGERYFDADELKELGLDQSALGSDVLKLDNLEDFDVSGEAATEASRSFRQSLVERRSIDDDLDAFDRMIAEFERDDYVAPPSPYQSPQRSPARSPPVARTPIPSPVASPVPEAKPAKKIVKKKRIVKRKVPARAAPAKTASVQEVSQQPASKTTIRTVKKTVSRPGIARSSRSQLGKPKTETSAAERPPAPCPGASRIAAASSRISRPGTSRTAVPRRSQIQVSGTSQVPTSGSQMPCPGGSRIPALGVSRIPAPGVSRVPSTSRIPAPGVSRIPAPGVSRIPSTSRIPAPGVSRFPAPGVSRIPEPGVSRIPGTSRISAPGASRIPAPGRSGIPGPGRTGIPCPEAARILTSTRISEAPLVESRPYSPILPEGEEEPFFLESPPSFLYESTLPSIGSFEFEYPSPKRPCPASAGISDLSAASLPYRTPSPRRPCPAAIDMAELSAASLPYRTPSSRRPCPAAIDMAELSAASLPYRTPSSRRPCPATIDMAELSAASLPYRTPSPRRPCPAAIDMAKLSTASLPYSTPSPRRAPSPYFDVDELKELGLEPGDLRDDIFNFEGIDDIDLSKLSVCSDIEYEERPEFDIDDAEIDRELDEWDRRIAELEAEHAEDIALYGSFDEEFFPSPKRESPRRSPAPSPYGTPSLTRPCPAATDMAELSAASLPYRTPSPRISPPDVSRLPAPGASRISAPGASRIPSTSRIPAPGASRIQASGVSRIPAPGVSRILSTSRIAAPGVSRIPAPGRTGIPGPGRTGIPRPGGARIITSTRISEAPPVEPRPYSPLLPEGQEELLFLESPPKFLYESTLPSVGSFEFEYPSPRRPSLSKGRGLEGIGERIAPGSAAAQDIVNAANRQRAEFADLERSPGWDFEEQERLAIASSSPARKDGGVKSPLGVSLKESLSRAIETGTMAARQLAQIRTPPSRQQETMLGTDVSGGATPPVEAEVTPNADDQQYRQLVRQIALEEEYKRRYAHRRPDMPRTPPIFSKYASVMGEEADKVYHPSEFGETNATEWQPAEQFFEGRTNISPRVDERRLATKKLIPGVEREPEAEEFFERESEPELVDIENEFDTSTAAQRSPAATREDVGKMVDDTKTELTLIKETTAADGGLPVTTPRRSPSPRRPNKSIRIETEEGEVSFELPSRESPCPTRQDRLYFESPPEEYYKSPGSPLSPAEAEALPDPYGLPKPVVLPPIKPPDFTEFRAKQSLIQTMAKAERQLRELGSPPRYNKQREERGGKELAERVSHLVTEAPETLQLPQVSRQQEERPSALDRSISEDVSSPIKPPVVVPGWTTPPRLRGSPPTYRVPLPGPAENVRVRTSARDILLQEMPPSGMTYSPPALSPGDYQRPPSRGISPKAARQPSPRVPSPCAPSRRSPAPCAAPSTPSLFDIELAEDLFGEDIWGEETPPYLMFQTPPRTPPRRPLTPPSPEESPFSLRIRLLQGDEPPYYSQEEMAVPQGMSVRRKQILKRRSSPPDLYTLHEKPADYPEELAPFLAQVERAKPFPDKATRIRVASPGMETVFEAPIDVPEFTTADHIAGLRRITQQIQERHPISPESQRPPPEDLLGAEGPVDWPSSPGALDRSVPEGLPSPMRPPTEVPGWTTPPRLKYPPRPLRIPLPGPAENVRVRSSARDFLAQEMEPSDMLYSPPPLSPGEYPRPTAPPPCPGVSPRSSRQPSPRLPSPRPPAASPSIFEVAPADDLFGEDIWGGEMPPEEMIHMPRTPPETPPRRPLTPLSPEESPFSLRIRLLQGDEPPYYSQEEMAISQGMSVRRKQILKRRSSPPDFYTLHEKPADYPEELAPFLAQVERAKPFPDKATRIRVASPGMETVYEAPIDVPEFTTADHIAALRRITQQIQERHPISPESQRPPPEDLLGAEGPVDWPSSPGALDRSVPEGLPSPMRPPTIVPGWTTPPHLKKQEKRPSPYQFKLIPALRDVLFQEMPPPEMGYSPPLSPSASPQPSPSAVRRSPVIKSRTMITRTPVPPEPSPTLGLPQTPPRRAGAVFEEEPQFLVVEMPPDDFMPPFSPISLEKRTRFADESLGLDDTVDSFEEHERSAARSPTAGEFAAPSPKPPAVSPTQQLRDMRRAVFQQYMQLEEPETSPPPPGSPAQLQDFEAMERLFAFESPHVRPPLVYPATVPQLPQEALDRQYADIFDTSLEDYEALEREILATASPEQLPRTRAPPPPKAVIDQVIATAGKVNRQMAEMHRSPTWLERVEQKVRHVPDPHLPRRKPAYSPKYAQLTPPRRSPTLPEVNRYADQIDEEFVPEGVWGYESPKSPPPSPERPPATSAKSDIFDVEIADEDYLDQVLFPQVGRSPTSPPTPPRIEQYYIPHTPPSPGSPDQLAEAVRAHEFTDRYYDRNKSLMSAATLRVKNKVVPLSRSQRPKVSPIREGFREDFPVSPRYAPEDELLPIERPDEELMAGKIMEEAPDVPPLLNRAVPQVGLPFGMADVGLGFESPPRTPRPSRYSYIPGPRYRDELLYQSPPEFYQSPIYESPMQQRDLFEEAAGPGILEATPPEGYALSPPPLSSPESLLSPYLGFTPPPPSPSASPCPPCSPSRTSPPLRTLATRWSPRSPPISPNFVRSVREHEYTDSFFDRDRPKATDIVMSKNRTIQLQRWSRPPRLDDIEEYDEEPVCPAATPRRTRSPAATSRASSNYELPRPTYYGSPGREYVRTPRRRESPAESPSRHVLEETVITYETDHDLWDEAYYFEVPSRIPFEGQSSPEITDTSLIASDLDASFLEEDQAGFKWMG